MVVVETHLKERRPSKLITDLSSVTTVGLDLAKHVFKSIALMSWAHRSRQSDHKTCWSFSLRCRPCLVGSRPVGRRITGRVELITLGHEVRVMPPAYVKPYIRRQKNDASDAAAICEAVTRPTMRFVGVRSLENRRR